MDQLTVEVNPGTLPGIRVLKLTGPFTLKDLFDFQTIVRTGSDPVTIIDLTGVPFIDSAALGSLVGVHSSCQRQKRLYAIVGIAPRIRVLFEVAGVDGTLVIYDTVPDAESHLTNLKPA
jgi:anti-anti-sigma factor